MSVIVAAAAAVSTIGGALTYGGDVVVYFLPTRAELEAHVDAHDDEREAFREWLFDVDLILTQNLSDQSRLKELEWEEKVYERQRRYDACIDAGQTNCELLSPKTAKEGLILQKKTTRGLSRRQKCLVSGKPPAECDIAE